MSRLGWWVVFVLLIIASGGAVICVEASKSQVAFVAPNGPTYMTSTTSAIGGGLLSAGSCASGTASTPGAVVGMAASSSPTTYPGDGAQWQTYISAPNVVTVKVCALLLLTPISTTYNVRVIP